MSKELFLQIGKNIYIHTQMNDETIQNYKYESEVMALGVYNTLFQQQILCPNDNIIVYNINENGIKPIIVSHTTKRISYTTEELEKIFKDALMDAIIKCTFGSKLFAIMFDGEKYFINESTKFNFDSFKEIMLELSETAVHKDTLMDQVYMFHY
jgi:hypothetical protein